MASGGANWPAMTHCSRRKYKKTCQFLVILRTYFTNWITVVSYILWLATNLWRIQFIIVTCMLILRNFREHEMFLLSKISYLKSKESVSLCYYPGGIELVFHTENSMKYRSLHTILKYRFNIPFRYEIPIFCTWKSSSVF